MYEVGIDQQRYHTNQIIVQYYNGWQLSARVQDGHTWKNKLYVNKCNLRNTNRTKRGGLVGSQERDKPSQAWFTDLINRKLGYYTYVRTTYAIMMIRYYYYMRTNLQLAHINDESVSCWIDRDFVGDRWLILVLANQPAKSPTARSRSIDSILNNNNNNNNMRRDSCLLYTSPSPRDRQKSRMPSSA